MRRINVVLILSLLISSCGQNELTNSSKETKSRSKRELREEQVEMVKKTLEETLRNKLSEDESKGLTFLKEALGDESKLNQILSLDESKVKEALKHINDELAKCTGDNAGEQKGTFKTLVSEYFKSNGSNLDNIVGENSQLKSTCGS
ncbi:Mlp family lipoprotein (plasmid) [Borrelia miyamotoi]|uniref:Mlp family lipoprotein n=1 Tax=Borrelia miyamotoi TaxID=47466 RepID=UPI00248EFCF7|nr:Mlp family lipoprotein [Borrelia miyamotoi]WGL35458.1 Mlp family lipoprotein [Borrelia miyamotoi]